MQKCEEEGCGRTKGVVEKGYGQWWLWPVMGGR
jgi:hypothetical protein